MESRVQEIRDASARAVDYASSFDKNVRPENIVLSCLKDWLSHAAVGENLWSIYRIGFNTATNEQVGHAIFFAS